MSKVAERWLVSVAVRVIHNIEQRWRRSLDEKDAITRNRHRHEWVDFKPCFTVGDSGPWGVIIYSYSQAGGRNQHERFQNIDTSVSREAGIHGDFIAQCTSYQMLKEWEALSEKPEALPSVDEKDQGKTFGWGKWHIHIHGEPRQAWDEFQKSLQFALILYTWGSNSTG